MVNESSWFREFEPSPLDVARQDEAARVSALLTDEMLPWLEDHEGERRYDPKEGWL